MRVLVTDSAARTSTAPERRRRSARSTGVVSPYDFRRPITLSREKARLLSIAFETFARQASTVMTSALRSVCEVELLSVDQVAYSEYVDTLGDMTYMTVFSMDPVTQPAVLQTPLAVTMTCIDNLLGGPGSDEQPERPLTDLESAVVGRLYERLVAEVRYAFSSLVTLDPEVTTVEYSPQLAQVAGASDVMVVARHVLRMGDAEFPLSVCMSFTGLLPYLNAADSVDTVNERDRHLRADASKRLAAGLQEIPVEVLVRFRTTEADPLELAGLRVGDVVRLKHPAQAPLDVTAADVVFAHATPGSQGRRLAALVVAPSNQEN
jgi:flagellar motor switch protein FliM